MSEVEKLELNKQQKHSIEIVVDRVGISPDNNKRILDSLETSLKNGGGKTVLLVFSPDDQEKTLLLNKDRSCPNGHGAPGDLEPRQFSFNSPHGACPTCTGLGVITEIDEDLIIPNDSLAIIEGCIKPLSRLSISGGWLTQMFEKLAKKYRFKLTTPWRDLSKKQQDVILYGTEAIEGIAGFEGIIPNLNRRYKDTTSESSRRDIESYMTKKSCSTCGGARLKQASLSVTINQKILPKSLN
ncbi:hypothetical protein HC864_03805 [Candidatus Gracilibacteria bacterium]|nr:hypothetical protein [Candidatus Gracilibacteria bacterium]